MRRLRVCDINHQPRKKKKKRAYKMDYIFILPLISAVPCALLGGIALERNPRNPANIGLALGMLSVSAAEAGGAALMGPPSLGGFGAKLFVAGQAALPAAWLIFSTVFARKDPKGEFSSRSLLFIGALSASAFFAFLVIFTGSVRPYGNLSAAGPFSPSLNGGPLLAVGESGKYFHIYLVLALSFNLVHLENTLRSAKGQDRFRIKYAILGAGSLLASFIPFQSGAALQVNKPSVKAHLL